MSVSRIAIVALVVLTAGQPTAQQPAVVFEHVTRISMDRLPAAATDADATVLIQNGVVTGIGSGTALSSKIPAGALRIDGRGKFLMPALAEMHAHIPTDPAEAERVLFMYVANGIGTIRSMLGDPSHFRLRERVMRGEIIGPTMILSGPSFNGQTAGMPAAAASRVMEQKKAGYDFLKIHPGIPLTAFNALAAAADKAAIRFAGHVPAEVGLQRAAQAKFWTIDHLDGYVEALAGPRAPASQNFGVNLMAHVEEARIASLAKETTAAGVWNVPTQILLENWYGPDSPEAMLRRPEMQYVRPAESAQWVAIKRDNLADVSAKDRARFVSIRRRLIKALQDAGGLLLLGSDAPQVWNVPGFSIHRELASYVDSGLTPFQALATGTRNVDAHLGTTALQTLPRARANLVLLDGNPLENIANTTRIAGVMVGGRWIPKAEIDRRLAEMRPR
ncbi:MAG TPA: amidohydrolase family protein [Vicinamibacterales bacterium]|jgi:imidazolonepropionase-like amidohydrolase|nr:amidohydrolase family protein [Vicinamibacterales bacterium]